MVARVELNPTTLEIEQGKSKTVEVKCYNSSNNLIPTRKLGEISITRKSGSTKVTVTQDTTYKNKATISVAGDQEVGNNKAVITATVSGVEAQEAKRCIINVKEKTQMIGLFIEYNVSYTDMCVTGQTFTKDNGWRILYAEEDTAHPGQYKNVKIVSTGIPAKLYYHYDGTNGNSWWGTTGNANEKATYGMKYNFTSIPMSSTTSPAKNAAGYGTITNGDQVANVTNTANGSIFITSKAKTEDDANTTEIESVHALTLEELNIARNLAQNSTTQTATTDGAKGLFYLRNLSQLDSSYGYTSSTDSYYWLASPYSGNTTNSVCLTGGGGGSIGYSNNKAFGLRPVVSLKSNIQQNSNGDWVIVE